MICPFCKKFIDDDSLYCDQCGKELKSCPQCNKPHRETATPARPGYLVGEGMKLELKAGPFGRTSGIYPEFASCIFVSGRHGEFAFSAQGWTVMDYGSTNGTYLNGVRLKPNTPYPLKHGDMLNVSRLKFTIQL